MLLSARPARRRLAALLASATAAGVLALPGVASAAAPPAAPEIPAGATVVPGQVVVRFAPGTTARERHRAVRAVGGRVTSTLAGARVVEIPDVATIGGALRELRARPEVATAAANPVARRSFVPRDPGFSGEPGGWQELQWNFAGPAGVNAPEAWDHLIAAGAPGARGAVVAVLDTGVAYKDRGRFRRSPDLAAARFRTGYDFVDGDREPFDLNGHGTHVTSTIAETTDNDVGVTGLAYRATILPVRVLDRLGEGDAVTIARGIRFAAQRGADVINLSLEFPTSEVRSSSQVPEIARAVRYARSKGATIVAAAGNEGSGRVAYPAKIRGVLAVGATTERACRSDFSNQGSGLDLVAPGGGFDAPLDDARCRPDLPGRSIRQVTLTTSVRRFGMPPDYEGTSMASAHVAAVAAMVLATGRVGDDPRPWQVEARLEGTARDLGAPGEDRVYGAGLLDAAAAVRP